MRPILQARHPVHVTMRARASLPSLRSDLVARRLRAIVESPRIDGFQVVHYSIQSDHIHMIVEAHDKRTLSSGVRSFVIRMAKRLNALFHRKGSLWGDRYHRHDLTTPRQVRNALAYVYANFKKHGQAAPGAGALDPFSSALTFDGWNVGSIVRLTGPPLRHHPPHTWLLRTGWLRAGGPIDVWLPIVIPKQGYGATS